MSISSINNSLPLLGPQPSSIGSIGQAINNNSEAFGNMLTRMLDETNSAQINGDKAITALNTGKAENQNSL